MYEKEIRKRVIEKLLDYGLTAVEATKRVDEIIGVVNGEPKRKPCPICKNDILTMRSGSLAYSTWNNQLGCSRCFLFVFGDNADIVEDKWARIA